MLPSMHTVPVAAAGLHSLKPPARVLRSSWQRQTKSLRDPRLNVAAWTNRTRVSAAALTGCCRQSARIIQMQLGLALNPHLWSLRQQYRVLVACY